MDVEDHIGILRSEGAMLAAAAERAGFDAAVPTCPGWSVRDLVRHIGGIHRWAATIVAEARPKPFDPFPELEKTWPPDAELMGWFHAGHANLLHALAAAPPDLECFTVFRLDPPRAFWARRQAHETGMHRADVESAAGACTPFAFSQAVDGIEELLFGFLVRAGSRLKADEPRALWLHTTDGPGDWVVRVGAEGPTVARETHPSAECRVNGRASDLFLLAWNRVGIDTVEVHGDASLLDLWRTSVQVRWR